MAGRICRFVATVDSESYSVTMLSCGSDGFFSRCEGHARRGVSRPSLSSLDAIRRPRDTPIWKLEASLECRPRKGRHAPPGRMIKLTEAREITPYNWVIQMKIERTLCFAQ
jgi:hypothetical protein